jgi:hypothetical protein
VPAAGAGGVLPVLCVLGCPSPPSSWRSPRRRRAPAGGLLAGGGGGGKGGGGGEAVEAELLPQVTATSRPCTHARVQGMRAHACMLVLECFLGGPTLKRPFPHPNLYTLSPACPQLTVVTKMAPPAPP